MGGVELTTLEIEARLKGVEQAIAGLDGLKTHGKGAEDSFASLAMKIAGFTSLANLAVSGGQKLGRMLVDAGKESIVLAAGFEKARITWGVLVGDMQKGEAVFEQIRDFAAKTPLSFEGLNQAATTVKGFGVATEDLIPTLSKLGDIAMGDNAKLQSMALVYGQVMAQGKAKTQDLYQFINAGVPIFNLLSESMNVSAGAIKDLAAEGAITFEEIDKAIVKATSANGQFFGMMDKTAESTSGKWSTALDNFKASLADLGERVLPLVNKALDAYNRRESYKQGGQDTWKFLQTGAGSGQAAMAWLRSDIAGLEAEIADVSMSALYGEAQDAQLARLNANLALAKSQLSEVQQLVLEQGRLKGSMSSGVVAPIVPVAAPKPAAGTSEFEEGSYSGILSVYDEPISTVVKSSVFDEYNRLNNEIKLLMSTESSLQNIEDEIYIDQQRRAGATEEEITILLQLRETKKGLAEDNKKAATEAAEIAALAKARLDEEIKALDDYNASIQAIDSYMKSMAMEAFVSGFQSLGEAMINGANAGDTFAASMANIGLQILNSMPQMLLQAGVQAMIAGQWEVGLGLIAASGLVAVGSGIANEIQSNQTPNSLGGVYSSRSLHSYVNGVYDSPQHFAFAQGGAFGWEGSRAFARGGVFGEAGAEAIMPLRRDSAGRLGVASSGSSVSVQVINNLGVESDATVTETTGSDGSRQIQVTLEKMVMATIASGKADGAMASRYGAFPRAQRRV